MRFVRFLACGTFVAMMPLVAGAAGTYYTGSYQSPQTSYASQAYANRYSNQYSGSYYTPSYASTRYNNTYANTTGTGRVAQQQTSDTANAVASSSKKTGFWMDAGVSYENAMWQFDMKSAGSRLHYDNIGWYVFDVDAGYAFDIGSMTMQIDAGVQYGIQAGESTMTDDDISNGGYFVTSLCNDTNGNGQCDSDEPVLGDQIGHAVSVGTSQGGSMLGFNAGIGLTDIFKIGNITFTPSIGYRYLQYKLTTENNNGLAVDTVYCFEENGETRCAPMVIVSNGNTDTLLKPSDINMEMPSDTTGTIKTPNTMYFHQNGISHSYEVAWSGPYVALDMGYAINQNNSVNGRIELGFPGYSAIGDQPYRYDWQHPKSVEDSAGMFSGLHFGAAANWSTALTNSIALTIGLTYDYYTVSGADANTYWNRAWYVEQLNAETEQDKKTAIQNTINQLDTECPGGVCFAGGEIDAFYKSMGFRIGINARF